MAIRSNHYEAAFEAFVRSLRVPCVAIDESKRAVFGEDGLKNPDFLLYPRMASNLVVEVKGKRGRNARGRRDWENWVTTDDLDGLVRWQAIFGPGFRSILAFVYAEMPPPFPLPRENGAFEFRGLEYRFWGVALDDYVAHLRSRGPAWKAVAMARRAFRRRVRPLQEWLPMTLEAPKRPKPVKERDRCNANAARGLPGSLPPSWRWD
ncbi:HYExAFE family protein [Aquisphaera insulae]|uniref:HYExAFE family protein n=1 Tax=Aquisphaera insulae TaxID=2712864 RepID=UPI0013EC56C0|nr:HYExAFE family protein [Aquisphaera insulae]